MGENRNDHGDLTCLCMIPKDEFDSHDNVKCDNEHLIKMHFHKHGNTLSNHSNDLHAGEENERQKEEGTTFAYKPSIEFQELNEKLKQNSVILIDVRSREELNEDGKIPGSFNIPPPEI